MRLIIFSPLIAFFIASPLDPKPVTTYIKQREETIARVPMRNPIANIITKDSVAKSKEVTYRASISEQPTTTITPTTTFSVITITENPTINVTSTEKPTFVTSSTEKQTTVVTSTEKPTTVVTSTENPTTEITSSEMPKVTTTSIFPTKKNQEVSTKNSVTIKSPEYKRQGRKVKKFHKNRKKRKRN